MKKTKKTKDVGIIFLGWFFIVLGIAGLFLPILQGVLFLFIGLYLLSKKSPLAKKLLNMLRRRCPGFAVQLGEARRRADRFLLRITGKN